MGQAIAFLLVSHLCLLDEQVSTAAQNLNKHTAMLIPGQNVPMNTLTVAERWLCGNAQHRLSLRVTGKEVQVIVARAPLTGSSLTSADGCLRFVHVHYKGAPIDPLLQARRRSCWTLHMSVSPKASASHS